MPYLIVESVEINYEINNIGQVNFKSLGGWRVKRGVSFTFFISKLTLILILVKPWASFGLRSRADQHWRMSWFRTTVRNWFKALPFSQGTPSEKPMARATSHWGAEAHLWTITHWNLTQGLWTSKETHLCMTNSELLLLFPFLHMEEKGFKTFMYFIF